MNDERLYTVWTRDVVGGVYTEWKQDVSGLAKLEAELRRYDILIQHDEVKILLDGTIPE
jgi:hypothetical protein